MAMGMGRELLSRGVAALALLPGFMQTERVWRPARAPFDLSTSRRVRQARRGLAVPTPRSSGSRAGRWPWATWRNAMATDVDRRRVPPFRLPDDL
jgi:hypothetical protein